MTLRLTGFQGRPDNSLTHWEYADSGANTDFKAGRNAGEILIRGTSNGQPLNKSLAAGNQIWLQNSEFGLPGVPKVDIRLVREKEAQQS